MKKQLLFLSLAVAALLVGCSKNESDPQGGNGIPEAGQITAKAASRGDVGVGTKAPISGATLDGKQADVYATSSPLHTFVGDRATMFTNAYARGTMTFNDVKYVGYDGGFTGNSLLPQDGTARYLTAFYPAGWRRAADATNSFETLSFAFDGKDDVMVSWMTGDPDVQVKHNDATIPERGSFVFKHLLTRCDVQVQAKDANAARDWGSVKSVQLKGTHLNTVSTNENLAYLYLTGAGTVSFFEMGGTDAARTYADDAFQKTAFNDMLPLTVDLQNACYSMIAPMDVDADSKTAELTLLVVTKDKDGGADVTTEVPVSLDQANFTDPANPNNTRGYALTLQLNFRAGAIKAIASVELWKDGGSQNEDVDGTEPAAPKIGELKGGGIVYEVNGSKAKVLSLDEGSLSWCAQFTYVIGTDGQNETDGKANVTAMKTYSANTVANSTTGIFATDFPAAHFCDKKNTGGVTGWYLPARDELTALHYAYKANKTAIDAGLTNNSGTAMPASGYLWSSTEYSDITSYAWYVYVLSSEPDYYKKSETYYVRCVREL